MAKRAYAIGAGLWLACVASAAGPAWGQSSSLYQAGGGQTGRPGQVLPGQYQAPAGSQASQGGARQGGRQLQVAPSVGGGRGVSAQHQRQLQQLGGGHGGQGGQRVNGRAVHPQLDAASFTAVSLPEPRHFAKEDLVTIIIREQTRAQSSHSLSTSKELEVDTELGRIPRFQARDLLNFQLRDGSQEDLPGFEFDYENDFDGEGDYRRRDEITTRLTARVVDVKPNGNLTLEARTHIRTDAEEQTIVVTGHARADDVSPDNTILSTQMFDLRVEREHEGELRRATRKGLFTRAIEFLFNF